MPITMSYNPTKRRAVYTFHNGRTLAVRNLTEEKAKQLLERDMPEFERRNGCLVSSGGHFTRRG